MYQKEYVDESTLMALFMKVKLPGTLMKHLIQNVKDLEDTLMLEENFTMQDGIIKEFCRDLLENIFLKTLKVSTTHQKLKKDSLEMINLCK